MEYKKTQPTQENIALRRGKIIMKKNGIEASFIQFPLFLTLINASASFGNGCCLGILN